MQQLFQKIQPKPLPATDEPPETSPALKQLWSRVETAKWKEKALAELPEVIWVLDADLGDCAHIQTCERCLFELQLSVERYLGTRGPWWINIEDGVDEYYSEEYPDWPKVEDYDIGSYWTGSTDDTLRFIKDRAAWAAKRLEKSFKAACKLVHILEDWPVTKPVPEVSWIEGMIEELAGNTTFFGVILWIN
jgi:hypothetical protein